MALTVIILNKGSNVIEDDNFVDCNPDLFLKSIISIHLTKITGKVEELTEFFLKVNSF